MRRPLDWIVVSISITVLFANRMLAPEPMELQAPGPQFQESAAEGPAIAQADNPFAYIREDGSLQFLPVAAPRVAGKAAKSPGDAVDRAVHLVVTAHSRGQGHSVLSVNPAT